MIVDARAATPLRFDVPRALTGVLSVLRPEIFVARTGVALVLLVEMLREGAEVVLVVCILGAEFIRNDEARPVGLVVRVDAVVCALGVICFSDVTASFSVTTASASTTPISMSENEMSVS